MAERLRLAHLTSPLSLLTAYLNRAPALTLPVGLDLRNLCFAFAYGALGVPVAVERGLYPV